MVSFKIEKNKEKEKLNKHNIAIDKPFKDLNPIIFIDFVFFSYSHDENS